MQDFEDGVCADGESGEVPQGVSEVRRQAGRLFPGGRPVRTPEPLERRLHSVCAGKEGEWNIATYQQKREHTPLYFGLPSDFAQFLSTHHTQPGQKFGVMISFFCALRLCLLVLQAQANGYGGPLLGPKESTKNVREFSDEQLRASEGIISAQAGTNQVASQAGMSFGKVRAETCH